MFQKNTGRSVKLLFVFAILFSQISCLYNHDITNNQLNTPPFSTLSIDFSNFNYDSTSLNLNNLPNWQNAVLSVNDWKLFINQTITIPSEVYAEAENQIPCFEAGSWLWSYNTVVDQINYSVNLYGTVENLNITWDLYISKEGYYSDFLWLTGYQSIDGTAGQWILNKSYEENYNFLKIDWTFENNDSSKTVKYTNIISDNENFGSTIFFDSETGLEMDNYLEIFEASTQDITKIYWNKTYKSGKILIPHNNIWFCWDENYEDYVCL